MDEMDLCSLDGLTVVCKALLTKAVTTEGKSAGKLVTLYNPNIETLKGFFLRVTRSSLRMSVRVQI